MNDILKQLNLIDHLTTMLSISKTDFVRRLAEITDIEKIGMLSDMGDVFSSSKNEYKGQVNLDGFTIKRRKRFFESNINLAIAKGTFTESKGQLIIETEINGFNNYFLFFIPFFIVFYFVFHLGASDSNRLIFSPILIVFWLLSVAIPYFMMRRSVK